MLDDPYVDVGNVAVTLFITATKFSLPKAIGNTIEVMISRYIIAFIVFVLFSTSSFAAKNHEIFELPKSNIRLKLELSDDNILAHKDRLVSLVDTALEEYTTLFGGLPQKINGNAYTDLHIVVSEGFGGEADPEFIELRISDIKLFGFYNWEMLLLHELLHLWSAETFRYADDKEQWFNEGVSEYLTFRLAAKLGIIKKENVLDAFSRPIGTYLSAKGIGKYSLRSAASTDQLKRRHYFLVYHGGFVAGMVLDHQIRSRSAGKFTLYDLMKGLYKSHSRDDPYSSDSILALLNKSMGLDFNGFFKRHIHGNQIIPVGRYFDIGRLNFSQQFGIPISDHEQQVLSDMLTFELP